MIVWRSETVITFHTTAANVSTANSTQVNGQDEVSPMSEAGHHAR